MTNIAIVGSGPETRDDAPWDDPSYKIWIFNEAATSPWCKRWDVVFQMHRPELYKAHNTKDPHHWDWLQTKHDKPVYMQAVDPLVPDSIEYPLDKAIELGGYRYLTSTVCYQIALAIMEFLDGKAEGLGVWGVELSTTEYKYQAEGIRYWVGLAKGIMRDKFEMHCGDYLFEGPLYGYEGNFSFSKEYFEERAKLLDEQWQENERQLRNMRNSLEDDVRGYKFDKVPQRTREFQTLALKTGEIAGALSEAQRYAEFGDRYADRGGFEHAAATGQRDGEAKRIEMIMKFGQMELAGESWMKLATSDSANTLLRYIQLVAQLSEECGAYLGKYRENIGYIIKYDDMYQANGKPVLNRAFNASKDESPTL